MQVVLHSVVHEHMYSSKAIRLAVGAAFKTLPKSCSKPGLPTYVKDNKTNNKKSRLILNLPTCTERPQGSKTAQQTTARIRNCLALLRIVSLSNHHTIGLLLTSIQSC